MAPTLTVIGIEGLPNISKDDDIAALTITAAEKQGTPLLDGDILVVTQKIISKAENQVVDLKNITPSAKAINFATEWGKDPRIVEIALNEAVRIVRMEQGILITETKHGFRCANSGIDASNVGSSNPDIVTLLPQDPDTSAQVIRARLKKRLNIDIPVIISDTFGRPWREGAINVAVGMSGIEPLHDYRGQKDTDGRILQTSVIAISDEISSAAELVMHKATGVPIAIIRNYEYEKGESGIAPMVRGIKTDLFT
jgi:coenzyme F420-0:L-glutamate ligase/coenzyme F420-1:gamma-L-glutamate ligase